MRTYTIKCRYLCIFSIFCFVVNNLICIQVLQAIGNLQEMDQKEDYMRCMCGLVKSNTGRLKEFVQQLVQVDQKEGNASCEPV